MRTLFATEITGQTLLGVDTSSFPVNGGNCFSVLAENKKEYRIVNFAYENLEELLKRGLPVPFKIVALSDHIAVINDENIGDRWYSTEYCETCCPQDLWPITQRLKRMREIALGNIQEYPVAKDGLKMTKIFTIPTKPKFP